MGLDFFAGFTINESFGNSDTSCNRSKNETRARAKYKLNVIFTPICKNNTCLQRITYSYSKLICNGDAAGTFRKAGKINANT
jgi:hypothetical protein